MKCIECGKSLKNIAEPPWCSYDMCEDEGILYETIYTDRMSGASGDKIIKVYTSKEEIKQVLRRVL